MPNNGTGPSGTPLSDIWNNFLGGLKPAPTYTGESGSYYHPKIKPSKAKPASASTGDRTTIGDQTYYHNNPSDQAAYEQLMEREQSRQRERGNGFSDIRGGDGRKPGTPVERFEDPRTITAGLGGRGDVRENAAGVVQKGTRMGGSIETLTPETAAQYLSRATGGYATGFGQNTFSSNQLPTTASNPFEGAPASTPTFNAKAPGITGANYDNYGADGGVAAASDTDSGKGPKFTGNEKKIEGGSERVKTSLADALGDTSGLKFDASKYKASKGFEVSDGAMSNESARRRAAFLDAPDSMSGLRAVEAQKNIIYAGGQHHGVGESGVTAINKDEYRGIMNDKTDTATVMGGYAKDNAPSSAQNPVVKDDSADQPTDPQKKAQAFVTSKINNITQGIGGGASKIIGGAVEFNVNNN